MFGGRGLSVVIGSLCVAACTSIGPLASPNSGTPVPVASTVAPTAPIASVATLPSDATPGTTRTPKPPKPPASEGPTDSAEPNLVVSKFALDADRIVAGQATDAKVTIKNAGSGDAGESTLAISYVDDTGASGTMPQVDLDAIPANGSVQLRVPLTVDHAGIYTFTAEADWFDDVPESGEDDNSAELQASAVSLPNLAFAPDGFSFSLDPFPQNGYDVNLVIANTGTAGVVDAFKVGLTYYTGAADTGTLEPYDCCTYEELPIIGAGGATGQLSMGGYHFTPGDYRIYAFLDDGRVVDESNEDDNEQQLDLHVP
jgi:CARDB